MEKTENFLWITFFIIGFIFIIMGLNACLGIFNNENKIETIGTITCMEPYSDGDDDIKYIVYVAYNVPFL